MKRRISILVILCIAPLCFSLAQNAGYGGKRVLLKTDILNGARSPLFSATAEFIVTRRFTASIGIRKTSGKYNQIFFQEEYATPNRYYENRLSEKATIESTTISAEARYYFSGIIPAPRGSFLFATYNYGSVDVLGNYRSSLTTNLYYNNTYNPYSYGSGNLSKDAYYTYKANDILVWGLEAGYGYQSFLNKFLVLGFKLGLNKTFFNADNNYEAAPLSGVAKTYGPNLLRLYPLSNDPLSLAPFSMDTESNYYKGSLGLCFYLQFGILIY